MKIYGELKNGGYIIGTVFNVEPCFIHFMKCLKIQNLYNNEWSHYAPEQFTKRQLIGEQNERDSTKRRR
jgi:hypothetical protein